MRGTQFGKSPFSVQFGLDSMCDLGLKRVGVYTDVPRSSP